MTDTLGPFELGKVHHADCLDAMAQLPENSVDTVITDPPYFKVKRAKWDRQWDTADQYIEWVGRLCGQWRRILKSNGSLYCFASPKMAARVEVEIGRTFNVLNSIVWAKPCPFSEINQGASNSGRVSKTTLRQFYPNSERVIFAEHYGADNMAKGEAGYVAKCDELRGFVFEPLRAYLDGERKRAGIDKVDCNAACGFSRTAGGTASRHYFSRSQWYLPTAEHYDSLRQLFNRDNGTDYLRREYEDLRREYEDLRRPFFLSADVPYTDVWTFRTVQSYPGKHPCEKPLDMIEHMVTASSRPGGVVLDPFAGSGTTGMACVKTGRQFIGFDTEAEYVEIANRRIGAASNGQKELAL